MTKSIGIVNFYDNKIPEILIKILSELCDNVIVISHKSDYMNIIKDSCIKNWIFSESNLNPNSENTPKIDIEKIAKIKGKNFLLIGYSMQKALLQKKYTLKTTTPKKYKITTNNESLFSDIDDKMDVVKKNNHFFDVETNDLKEINIKSTYNNMLMIAKYKKILMTDFCPEHSEDGMQLLENWIK